MRIQSTASENSHTIKIVVAAEAGNGKTTLASTIEKSLGEKVLVISAEAGLLSLKEFNIDFLELQREWSVEKNEWIEIPKEQRISRLKDIFDYVSKPEIRAKYKWLFIDSLTEINQNMLELIETIDEFQGPKNTIKKYGELSTRMRSLAKAFRDLPGYNVVFSALVKEDTDNDGKKFVKIDMVGKFADQLPALFDEIFYLGVMPEIGEDGRNIRQILTQKTDKILFPKDRSGALERVEPADLGAIIKKIRGRMAPILGDISSMGKEAAAIAKAKKQEGEVRHA